MSETPVEVGRHYLRMLASGFECIQCGLSAADVQTLHDVPCKASVQLELHYQTQKLFRLKQLQLQEQELMNKLIDRTPSPTVSDPVPTPATQGPCRCLRHHQ